jgi:hypothetical protein
MPKGTPKYIELIEEFEMAAIANATSGGGHPDDIPLKQKKKINRIYQDKNIWTNFAYSDPQEPVKHPAWPHATCRAPSTSTAQIKS